MGQTGHTSIEGTVITVAQILVVCPFTQLFISSLNGIFWAEANDLPMEHVWIEPTLKAFFFFNRNDKKGEVFKKADVNIQE